MSSNGFPRWIRQSVHEESHSRSIEKLWADIQNTLPTPCQVGGESGEASRGGAESALSADPAGDIGGLGTVRTIRMTIRGVIQA